MQSVFFYQTSLDGPFPVKGVFDKFFFFIYNLLVPCYTETNVLNANGVDPDKMPRLIWVYTVCHIYRTLGTSVLKHQIKFVADDILLFFFFHRNYVMTLQRSHLLHMKCEDVFSE